MTEEERRKLLVSQLRGRDRDSAPAHDFLCVDAADEIERIDALAVTLCDSRVTHQLPLDSTEIVGRDCFPGLRVSTVWLPTSEETLETVIFKRLSDGQLGEEIYSERYASYKAAERGHVRICTLVRDIQKA